MRYVWARAFGRLWCDAEVHTTDDGKRFMLATIENDKRTLHTGKTYAQRVVFRSFDEDDIAVVDQLRKGTWIMVDGETDAVTDKSSTGWWYANSAHHRQIAGDHSISCRLSSTFAESQKLNRESKPSGVDLMRESTRQRPPKAGSIWCVRKPP